MDLQTQARHVLANYMNEAKSHIGKLPEGVGPEEWMSDRFLAWWSLQVGDEVDDALGAIEGIRAELQRLGGWSNPELGDAMHELIHASDAISSLRYLLGVSGPESDQASP